MADDPNTGLAPNWEAVTAEDGRVYWWNLVTTETTWEKPVEVVAKKGIAAGYLNKVKTDDAGRSSIKGSDELDKIRRRQLAGGGVSARLKAFEKKEGDSPGGLDSSRRKSSDVDEVTEKFGSTEMVGNQAVERQIGMGIQFGMRGPPLLNPTPTIAIVNNQEPGLFRPPAAVEAPSGKSGSNDSLGEPSPTSPGVETGRKSAMSVDMLKKYREAKQQEHQKDSPPVVKGTPRGRGERPAAPPKVDLYK